jgi:hypothetical protein
LLVGGVQVVLPFRQLIPQLLELYVGFGAGGVPLVVRWFMVGLFFG